MGSNGSEGEASVIVVSTNLPNHSFPTSSTSPDSEEGYEAVYIHSFIIGAQIKFFSIHKNRSINQVLKFAGEGVKQALLDI